MKKRKEILKNKKDINDPETYDDDTSNILTVERRILLHTFIDISITSQFIKILLELQQQPGPIIIDINCPGGDVDAIISMIAHIYRCKEKIITDVTGTAYSGGAFIALTGKERIMFSGAELMFHNPLIDSPCESIEKIEELINYSRERIEKLVSMLLKDTKMTYSDYQIRTENRNWYLNPKEAKKLNIITGIY